MGEAKRAALALEQALRLSRRTLADLESDDERRRRIDALAHIRGIHEAPGGADCSVMLGEPVRYSFKLVFPDGRWAIDEKQLVERPHAGDLVEFEDFGGWRIESEQRVGVKPAGKAQREFFVCAPAA